MSTELATIESKEVAVQQPKPPKPSVVPADERGLKFQSMEDMWRFATAIANSNMHKDCGTPEVAFVKMQAGMELGLSPIRSLSAIATINGKIVLYGDALLGVVRGHRDCEDVIETITGEGENAVATCEVKRRGCAPTVRHFSVADAKKAKLWGKGGPWSDYPMRMLAMRARSFACRDAFADAISGIGVAEEVSDYQAKPTKVTQIRSVLPEEGSAE